MLKLQLRKRFNIPFFFFIWQESENMEFCWLILPFAKDLVLSFLPCYMIYCSEMHRNSGLDMSCIIK